MARDDDGIAERASAKRRRSRQQWRDAPSADERELMELDASMAEVRTPKDAQPIGDYHQRYAKALDRSQPGHTRTVTAATVPSGVNNAKVPLQVARVQVDPDQARPWSITLNTLGNVFNFGFDNPVPILSTNCLLRWGRAGMAFDARFDWRVGQVVSVHADFVEVSVEFDPFVFDILGGFAPASLTAGATIVEAEGSVAPTWRPTLTQQPITANSLSFSPQLPVPKWAQRLYLYETRSSGLPPPAGAPPPNNYYIEFLAHGGAAPATVQARGSNLFFQSPLAPFLPPGFATRWRVFNMFTAAEPIVTYRGVWELAF